MYTKTMVTKITQLPQLKPVKFPRSYGSGKVVYKIQPSVGQPTKKVVAEIKRLAKKDIYPPEQ